jgi:hypothetical protein
MRPITSLTCAVGLVFLVMSPVFAERVVSDGSDGPFSPTTSQTIQLNSVAPDGVLNYTTIHIPANVTITFARNSRNTPVFLAATGDVLIEGTINVSGVDFSLTSGPGGWDGGQKGTGPAGGSPGTGPSPGQGGPPPSGNGNAGGGGGMATPGLKATSHTGGNPAEGGLAIPRPPLIPNRTGGGGSGGGGGGGRVFYGVNLDGGPGGGGSGGLQISTPGSLTLTGKILANGGHGCWGFANALAAAGPGGGGAGGNVELFGHTITIASTAIIEARGGAGGGYSTEPCPRDPFGFSSGAHGGQGYLFLCGGLTIDPAATITATLDQPGYARTDFNTDGHVDLDDFEIFQPCVSGSTVPLAGSCGIADLDADGDVDADDFGVFQRCYSGPVRSADPCCGY